MKMNSNRLLATLTFLGVLGVSGVAHADRIVRVVESPYGCAVEARPRHHRGHHRGWYRREPIMAYVPVLVPRAAYREAAYRRVREPQPSFYLNVSDAGTSFGIALGR